MLDGAYNIYNNGDASVTKTYCQMTSLEGCAGGGWTMVMKIDGKKFLSSIFRKYYYCIIAFENAYLGSFVSKSANLKGDQI